MKIIAVFLALFLLLQLAHATSPKSDPSLMTIERLSVVKKENRDMEVSYLVGSEAKRRLLKKVQDLAKLENISYEVQEQVGESSVNIKITFKNGLLLDESLTKIISQLP